MCVAFIVQTCQGIRFLQLCVNWRRRTLNLTQGVLSFVLSSRQAYFIMRLFASFYNRLRCRDYYGEDRRVVLLVSLVAVRGTSSLLHLWLWNSQQLALMRFILLGTDDPWLYKPKAISFCNDTNMSPPFTPVITTMFSPLEETGASSAMGQLVPPLLSRKP